MPPPNRVSLEAERNCAARGAPRVAVVTGANSGIGLLRELWDTRHVPAYAADPANVERMWSVAREVIDEPLARAASGS